MFRVVLATSLTLVSAFQAPSSLQTVSRVAVTHTADVQMAAKKAGLFNFGPASPTKPKVTSKARPLSPGSNYPTTKNIQTQSNGFGTFISKFQGLGSKDKSKYGVPVFLPSGNINPAYLAAERKAMAAQKAKNIAGTAAKMNKLKSAKKFELADFVRKKIGNVGSGKDYYQSGR